MTPLLRVGRQILGQELAKLRKASSSSVIQDERYSIETSRQMLNEQTAAADDDLAANVVRFRAAEQIDSVRRLFRRAATSERNHSGHGVEHLGLHADLDVAASDVNGLLLCLDRLGQAGIDQAKGDAVDVDTQSDEFTRDLPHVKPR